MRITLLCLLLLGLAGCDRGPVTGTVNGQITLDGTPVPDGLIRFIPADGTGQPEDCVITAGRYSVTMAPGEKRIEIFWLKEEGTVKADTATQGNMKQTQMIPEIYNTKSTLTYAVVVGPQTKDFELRSR